MHGPPARDIDQIVATHQLARDRVRAGRPVWDRKIDVKAIIHRDQDNDDPTYAARVAGEIAALLRARVPAGWLDVASDGYDSGLDEIVDLMESLAGAVAGGDTRETLNHVLADLYDWADASRVWLGA